jgi:hypothetical protein
MALCNIKRKAGWRRDYEKALKAANPRGLIINEEKFSAGTGPGPFRQSHGPSGKANSWRWHRPYFLVLGLAALAGVAYANIS